ncbi:phosphoserine phosphatase-like [Centruroides sculpturatus]|uniref:phosphoserine phosphatase-like n=1 Tax=Centruroides sculpturatus TaxID=218467 RepID=UPI000C6C9244|nr:phosphoserine phosphatase-like [Centruroides sculpturatus]XP_023238305.1 phosphoserine phosphatase-like [Centruroides sculpturatus]XP_023238306.1 phosphoserine phosphatase-like [Centruroides sculpturatus]
MSLSENMTRTLWRAADAICFDVDSTVCQDEAIDELAKFAGKEKEVAEMTQIAMRGGMSFRDALAQRLELIRPTGAMLQEYLRSHPPHLTPGIKELISILHNRQIPVYLVSGGFHAVIEPVAEELSIPMKNVFANRIKFYFDGTYAGFDETQPTSNQDGKAQVVNHLKQTYGYERLVMVGDGATDLAACPPAEGFIGFGGNQVRESVKKEAAWFVTSFYELIEELNRN